MLESVERRAVGTSRRERMRRAPSVEANITGAVVSELSAESNKRHEVTGLTEANDDANDRLGVDRIGVHIDFNNQAGNGGAGFDIG